MLRYFLGDSFRKRSVFSAIWFDNGYMFASAHEVLSDKGVDMPIVMLDSLVQTVLGQVVDVPVVVQRQVRGQVVQKAVLVPQLPFIAGRRHPGHGAEADSHDFPFSEDHRDSPAQYFSWWWIPLLCRFAGSRCRRGWYSRELTVALVENIVVSWCRRGGDSRDLTVATVEKIVVSRRSWTRLLTCPLACRHGAAHRRGDELMGWVSRALHTGIRPPFLDAFRWRVSTETCVIITVRTTTTTTTTTTTQGSARLHSFG